MYDVIVVGARCGGSPTAMLLARKGYRVLLVDKAHFPSDMVLSTHLIHPPGIARLKRWGLLERLIASGCPPITRYHCHLGPLALTGTPPPVDGVAEAYAPRRKVLDAILVEAAVAAGVELRQAFAVEAVLFDGDRVTGVRGRTRGGVTVTETARLVIGADGMNSLVARQVGAQSYLAKPPLEGAYFSYWSGVPMQGFELYTGEGRGVFGAPTNDDLTLIGVGWVVGDLPAARADLEGTYLRAIAELAPGLAARITNGRREGRFIGAAIDNYFRQPYGPGWALVGDAGYKKDPCTAAGITDAFRDAELLAEALDAGLSGQQALDAALTAYEQHRNAAALPVYEFTCQSALMQTSPEEHQLFAALQGNQPDTDRFCGVLAQTVPVPEFFAPENIDRILTASGARQPAPA